MEDTCDYSKCTSKQVKKRTVTNLCTLYTSLFDLKRKEEASHGDDGEILEYAKSYYTVRLPESQVVLPREKRVPKDKQMTKWEKFRLEAGMPARKARSRMVFDPVTNDWVPRHGMGSVKKIADAHNWLMHEKPKHREAGVDPFTYEKAEKKAKQEK